uniref:Protein TEX261 n=1 Tax=Pyramimonas obovata TaxID=1411642 RepID=A0A7S0WN95_9CHLO|mmetsp:Transcript_31710/g.69304  ORF Transcript_31710/g.69304 Transcript_31710/m.69304 type:complete len:230 (+) Transcript_31710:203-892(+)
MENMLSLLVVYAGGYTFLVFLAVCMATGLYYLAELVEEYTTFTKKVITYAVYGIVGVHVLLLVVDRLPFLCIASGVAAHGAYFTLLKKFPFISLTSPEFLASCALLALNHYMWLKHFMQQYYTVEYVMGFFLICVWLVPFGFFISLAANESVLPMSGGGAAYGSSSDQGSWGGGGGVQEFPADGAPPAGKTKGGLLSFMKFVKSKGERVLPQVMPQMGIQRNKDYSRTL